MVSAVLARYGRQVVYVTRTPQVDELVPFFNGSGGMTKSFSTLLEFREPRLIP